MKLGDITDKGFYLGNEQRPYPGPQFRTMHDMVLKFDHPRHLSFNGLLEDLSRRVMMQSALYGSTIIERLSDGSLKIG